jgi:hypothetical protein
MRVKRKPFSLCQHNLPNYVLTCRLEKLTQSCQWESPFVQGGNFNSFIGPKHLFSFQVGDYDYQGCVKGVFPNNICKLNRITRHGCSLQEKFTFRCNYRNRNQKPCWIVVKTLNFFIFSFRDILKLY